MIDGPPETLVRDLHPRETAWRDAMLVEAWGSVHVARMGELVDASSLPCFVAERDGVPCGLAVVAHQDDDLEVVALLATVESVGIGRALLSHCLHHGLSLGCRRLWLITTNDNLRALRFYQQFGMDLCALHRNAVDRARTLKPEIPLRGAGGIPIRHELELEIVLTA